MLGRSIADPDGIEGTPGATKGLGLLNVETVMVPDKRVTESSGRHLGLDLPVRGYEIHIGRTTGPDCARPVLEIEGRPEGARSADGLVEGLYLHGLFQEDDFRTSYLATFGATGPLDWRASIQTTLDALADHLETHADIDAMMDIAALHG